MNVYLGDEVSSAINEVISNMKSVVLSTQNFSLNKEKEKLVLKTSIQNCINYQFSDPLKNTIHKILIEYCFLSEKLSPGGFIETVKHISSLINDEHNEITYMSLSEQPTIDDLSSFTSLLISDESLKRLCLESIKLAGFGGKITIEKSINQITSIEVIDGYSFKHKSLGLKPLKLVKPNVVCIDGYIESVSEINRLFEDAVELKHPVVLISRGLHDEVLNTIKINKDRKTMFIYPIIIDFDLNGINTIADICVVSNLLPVSEKSGDLISSVSMKNCSVVDELSIIDNVFTIKNSKSKANVNIHIKNLIEKRSESNQEIEGLLTTRIKSLSSNNVIIRLPDDSSYVTKVQTIDYFLRSIKSMLDYGIIFEKDSIHLYGTKKSSFELSKKFIDKMTNLKAALC